MDATRGTGVSCISPKSDSQQSRVFPESCTLLFMPNVVVETQESVVMLPEIASSAARLATSSKMARRTLRQVHLVTLTRKPDISGRVFAITQNQTTNISEELPGISSIRDVEYDIELLPEQSLLQKLLIAYPHCMYGVDKSSFHKFLDKFVIMLIDDILIFSKSNEEHEDHLRTVIQILRQEKLYAKFSKCKFWLSKVVFLGHVVPAEGITMDPAKVEVVAKWPRSTSETEARCFLGLAGHYHRVVEGSSRLALPLTKLTRKDEKLWISDFQKCFLNKGIDCTLMRHEKEISYVHEIVQLHGTPSAIVSDKDPRFTFRILETHTRQEGYTNKLSRPLKLSAKLSCFLESIAYEWRQTSHKYHSFHDVSYPHDQIHEDLSHLNEPEAILNCQDRVLGDGILGKRDVLRMRATLRLTLLYGLPHVYAI
ncbi:putative reverse transcriptase domain-containing protein [Tanacetum coccineum]